MLFDSIVHVSMSRGNSSLLKERSVSLNLVSSDVKILAFMTKFLSLKTDTGLEVRRGFRMWNSNFAKPASCNEVCSVKLVASRLALCGDWFELFWRRYCCLRVCVCVCVCVLFCDDCSLARAEGPVRTSITVITFFLRDCTT